MISARITFVGTRFFAKGGGGVADDAKDFAARYEATESSLAVDARAVAAAPAGLSTGLVALVSFFVGAVLSNKLMDPRKRGRVELP